MDTFTTPTSVLPNYYKPELSALPRSSLEVVALMDHEEDEFSLALQGVDAPLRVATWNGFYSPDNSQLFDVAENYESGFDYTGKPLGIDPFTTNYVTTQDFSFSDPDLGNMLSFTPGIRYSQTSIASIPANHNKESEYSCPQLSASMFAVAPFSSETASIKVSADLSVIPYGDVRAEGLLRPVLMVDQSDPQSIVPQQHTEVKREENEARTTLSAPSQKRAHITTNNHSLSAGEQYKPKRQRGARKRVRTDEEIAIRRENHLQRNRDAARKCRQKKKLTEAEKRGEIVEERNENHITWNNVGVAQLAVEQFRNLAREIQGNCLDSERKTAATLGLQRVVSIAQTLQDQVEMLNEKRGSIAEGLIMHKLSGVYVQQDSMQDAQNPGTSPQSSNYLHHTLRMTLTNSDTQMIVDDSTVQIYSPSGHRSYGIASRPSSCASLLLAHQIDTNFTNDVAMSQGDSNSSTQQPGSTGASGVGSNSPPYARRNSPHEDEAIDDSSYSPKMSPAKQNLQGGHLAARIYDSSLPVVNRLSPR